ncbi:ATP/GTP-binding protein [Streptomyces sp. NBC_01381]|uniref:ATP/GTP-binding protein n=1 Tax=Streptomyces sp. NBC_01381 TaxID=2903845 RepID=UPI002258C7DD|nr:ATP/GTP-binding protein [Streptomyces sp. NBC_01381]MCX4673650.1 ATP/GTP-binding protein [Streptomyces sp. NBC_01381]
MLKNRLLTIASTTVLLGMVGTTLASAKPEPKPNVGSCAVLDFCVGSSVAGSPGSSHQKPGKPSGKGRKGPNIPGPCVVTKMDPQPPAGSAAWDGHDPSEGAIYTRTCPASLAAGNVLGGLAGAPQTFWAAQPPVAKVDPAQLAQEAVDKMTLLGPDIDINPKPGGKGLTGMPVWMAADQSQTTWGPNSASASAGGITVTATAKVSKVVWDMGDGKKIPCVTAGTPYKKSFGMRKSPDCGHIYTQTSREEPGGKFGVTATATWSIDWQVNGGGGETGELTEIRQSQVALTIIESQAVN